MEKKVQLDYLVTKELLESVELLETKVTKVRKVLLETKD